MKKMMLIFISSELSAEGENFTNYRLTQSRVSAKMWFYTKRAFASKIKLKKETMKISISISISNIIR
jgi:hypothetical protein